MLKNKQIKTHAAIDLLNNIIMEAGGIDNITNNILLKKAYQDLMNAERTLHLENNSLDKGNGFYDRSNGTATGVIDVKVPRDRDGDFRPQLLPDPYVRDSKDRVNILQSLITSNYSPSQIQDTFQELGLHYNPSELETLKHIIIEDFNVWKSRQLHHDVVALLIDAYQSEALHEGRVKKRVTFVVIGVDFNGQKDLYGVYFLLGSESKSFWLQVFNDVIDRGLKRPLIIVSDDFPGLKDAIATLFPQSLHQVCFVHMQRNLRRNMSKDHSKSFLLAIDKIKLDSSYDEAIERFHSACEPLLSKYPAFVKILKDNASFYFAFLKLSEPTRKYFYTTNAVESFNSILEKLRHRSGGFFQSQNQLKINIYLAYQSLVRKKWKHPVPLIASDLYNPRQIFAQSFGDLPLA